MKFRHQAIVAGVTLLPLLSALHGQEIPLQQSVPTSQPSAAAPDLSPLSIRFSGAYSPRTDLEGGGGFARDSWTAAGRYRLPLARNLFATAGVSYTQTFYQFSGEPRIAGSDRPWSQANRVDLSTGLLGRIDRHWSAFAGVRVESSGQTAVNWGETFTYGGMAGATYRFSDQLSVGMGIIARSRLEDSTLALPFPVFSYVLPFDEDRWRIFSSAGGIGAALGGNASGVAAGLSYIADNRLTLAAGLSGLGLVNDFRLNPRSPVPNGVVRDRSTQLMVEADYRPIDGLSIAGFLGADLPGKLTVLSSSGSDVYSATTSAVPVVGIAVHFHF